MKVQNVHPLFVHFPIALLSVGWLCDLLGVIFKKDSLRHAGWWASLFGTVAIVATVITGLLAERTVGHSEVSHKIMERHKTLELSATGVFVALFVWRVVHKGLLLQGRSFITYLVVGAVGVVTMFVGAHFGGRLVYEFGVGGSAMSHSQGIRHQHSQSHDHDKATEDKAEHNHRGGHE